MSQENVEVVRRAYEAQTDGRLDDWFEFLDPEIEWRGPREFPDLAEPHFGHEGVARYVAKVNEVFDDYRMVPEEFIDAGGDQVLVFSREGGRGKGSGAEVESKAGEMWTFRDGKVMRHKSFDTPAEALEAAGLSE
jgi:ketosteroid isomerase-like protein